MDSEPVFVYVEDDDSSREVMRMLLTYRLGYASLTVFEETSDFVSKLDKLSPPPSVFFLDIHVKPHNGFEILKTLRNNKRYAQATIVAVTASVMNEEVEALQSAGFDSVISKPIDPDSFPKLVGAILKGEKVWQISL